MIINGVEIDQMAAVLEFLPVDATARGVREQIAHGQCQTQLFDQGERIQERIQFGQRSHTKDIFERSIFSTQCRSSSIGDQRVFQREKRMKQPNENIRWIC